MPVGVPLLERDETPFGTAVMSVLGVPFWGVLLLEAVPFVTGGTAAARDGPNTALAGELAVGHPGGNTLGDKC